MTNNPDFTFQAPTTPFTLPASDYFIVDVTFEPQTQGILEGMLDVYTTYNPINPQPAASVAFTGEGTPQTEPDISITPDQYFFTSQQIQLSS